MYHQKLNVMRKSVLLIMMLFTVSMAANAQKFALIDTEYIMKNIPAAQKMCIRDRCPSRLHSGVQAPQMNDNFSYSIEEHFERQFWHYVHRI